MRRSLRIHYHGFTLIELLVSLSIFSVISLAVYSSFAAGVGAWRKAQEFSSVYQMFRLLLDDMAGELKNTVKVSGTEFNGGPRSLSFVTLHQSPYPKDRQNNHQIIKVAYEIRRDRGSLDYVLFRRESSNINKRGEAQLIAGSISSLDFQYTHKNSEGKLQPWNPIWKVSDEIPLGVKITLIIRGVRFTKMVLIPHGFREEEKS